MSDDKIITIHITEPVFVRIIAYLSQGRVIGQLKGVINEFAAYVRWAVYQGENEVKIKLEEAWKRRTIERYWEALGGRV